MSKKVYIVDLTEQERTYLLGFIKSGTKSARKLNRARILLLADEGKTDPEIVDALHSGSATVQRIRKRFVEGNLERALNEDPRPGGIENWMRRQNPFWNNWPAASHRMDEKGGRCNCWPTAW